MRTHHRNHRFLQVAAEGFGKPAAVGFPDSAAAELLSPLPAGEVDATMSTPSMKQRHRSNGEGTIYKRADGRWGATLSLPGGRRQTVYARSQAAVKERLKELIERRDQGLLVGSRDQKLEEYLLGWLEDVARPAVRQRTYIAYRDNLRRLLPLIGHHRLSQLSAAHIQHAYGVLLKSTSARSVHHSHAVLRAALRQAVRMGLLYRNPIDGVSPPRPPRLEMKTLGHDQVKQLLASAEEDRFLALWTLMVSTGLRIGEAIGLRWQDLDEHNGRLSIQRALQRQEGNGLVFVEPKSRQSRRTIHLSRLAQDALRRHRQMQAAEQLAAGPEWQEHGLIFTTTVGRPLDPNHVYVSFQRALRRAGLPHIRLHDLRHTAATLLLADGVHPKLVQEMLGHSSITLTLDTYSHVTPALHAEVAARMDALLG